MGTLPPPDQNFMDDDLFISSLTSLDATLDPQLGIASQDIISEAHHVSQSNIPLKAEEYFPAPSENSVVQVGIPELAPMDPLEYSWPVDDITIPTNMMADFDPFKIRPDEDCGVEFNKNIFTSPLQLMDDTAEAYTQPTIDPTGFDLISHSAFELPELLPDNGEDSSRRSSNDSNCSKTSFKSSSEEASVAHDTPPAVELNKHGKPKQKRGRKRSNISDEERKRRRLERGKKAANKCRSKKKEKEDALVAKVDTLAIENEKIRRMKASLETEKTNLMTIISGCAASETCLVSGSKLGLAENG